jgi:hypothetical protein
MAEKRYTFFNFRTGKHTRSEGEVWPEWDGPDFDGYYKCENGKRVPATRKEFDEYKARKAEARKAG